MQPYVKIGFLVEAGIAKRQTASVYLQELEKVGVLQGERGGRHVFYRHEALIDMMDP